MSRRKHARTASEADKGPMRRCQVCCLRYPVTLTTGEVAPLHTVRSLSEAPHAHVCMGSGLTRREQSALIAAVLQAKLHAFALRHGHAQRGKA